jgi:hypothetical protein
MRNLKVFVKSILLVELAAVSGLLISGAILSWIEGNYHYGESFFTYRIQHLDFTPAWYAASLMLMAINGFWMFRLASIEGAVSTPQGSGWGQWSASFPVNPLRLFAVNLVAIPAAIALFMIIRANQW